MSRIRNLSVPRIRSAKKERIKILNTFVFLAHTGNLHDNVWPKVHSNLAIDMQFVIPLVGRLLGKMFVGKRKAVPRHSCPISNLAMQAAKSKESLMHFEPSGKFSTLRRPIYA